MTPHARNSISCPAARDWMLLAASSDLDASSCVLLARHLARCEGCRGEWIRVEGFHRGLNRWLKTVPITGVVLSRPGSRPWSWLVLALLILPVGAWIRWGLLPPLRQPRPSPSPISLPPVDLERLPVPHLEGGITVKSLRFQRPTDVETFGNNRILVLEIPSRDPESRILWFINESRGELP